MEIAQDLMDRPNCFILEGHIASNPADPLLLCSRWPARKSLLHFAIAQAFRKTPRAVARDYLAPEGHRAGVAHIFDDFPFPGEAVEYQGRGVAADPRTPILHSHKELRHAVIGGFFSGLRKARTSNQRESYGIISLENQQRVRLIVGEPVGENLRFMRIVRPDDRE